MIKINNLTKEDLKEFELEKLINFAVAFEELDNVSFSVVLVNDEQMRGLNYQYRQKNKTTDVLAFALENKEDQINPPIRLLGDIYISVPQAKKQATEAGCELIEELANLMLHGFYHLLGWTHENEKDKEIMFQKQKEVLMKYGISK